MLVQQVQAEVLDVRGAGVGRIYTLPFEVYRSTDFPLYAWIFSEAHPFKREGSTSQETPPNRYVQEKRASTQLSLRRPSPELLHPR